jgi:hypothetical protein
MELVNKASERWDYVKIVEYADGSIGKKPSLSIGGAVSSQWKDGKDFYYWPRLRLAGRNYLALVKYALMNGLVEGKRGAEVTFGPFIGKGGSENEILPEAFMLSGTIGSMSKGKFAVSGDIEYDSSLLIPSYSYSLTTADGEQDLTITEKGKGRNPVDYLLHEKEKHTGYSHQSDDKVNKAANLDTLAKNIYDFGLPKRGSKGSKSGRSAKEPRTFEGFNTELNSRATRNAKKSGIKASKYLFDISKLTDSFSSSRVKPQDKFSNNYIRGGEGSRIIFTAESARKSSSHSGPIWYYRLKHGWLIEEEEDSETNVAANKAARKELKSLVEEDLRVASSKKARKSKKAEAAEESAEEEASSKKKKKARAKKEEAEEEEEE